MSDVNIPGYVTLIVGGKPVIRASHYRELVRQPNSTWAGEPLPSDKIGILPDDVWLRLEEILHEKFNVDKDRNATNPLSN